MDMIDYRRKQTGGTLLGLVIGLIIGLGIAVVVAITIKNTPLPFVDKLAKPDRPAASGKMSDPNKPLYGNRESAKEAAKQFSRKAETPAADAALSEAQGVRNSAPKDAAKPNAKPAEAKTATLDKSAATAKTEEKYTYYLQAGAFLQQADAENTKAKLALLGFSAHIAERESENGTLYRVRIGPFSEQPVMNRMRSKLSDNGVDAAVVRVPK
ncbi:MAG: SPOR domain-containing protein [Burkholderiaceae bacterium]